jgi:16S rRNA processing protein RimM
MTGSAKICVAVVTGAHGVRGGVKLKSFTVDAESVVGYGPLSDKSGERRFHVRLTGEASNGQWIATIKGITDRDTAAALRGTELYVDRDALPAPDEDEFYHADLIGLRAELVDGAVLGTVLGVHDFGAGDMLEVQPPRGPSLMVPFLKAVVPVVDMANGRVIIDPPAGLLDGGKPDDVPDDGQMTDAESAEDLIAAPAPDDTGRGTGG